MINTETVINREKDAWKKVNKVDCQLVKYIVLNQKEQTYIHEI